MIRRIGMVATLVLCVGRSTAAQDAAPLIANDREASAQLREIIDATRAQDLPVDPILSLVNRGLLITHSPPQRIVAAARAIAARLPVARDALSPRDTPADIIAAQEALSFNVPRGVVTQIRQASVEPSVAVPLGTLTQLVASNVSVKRASEIVLSLVRRGATSQQLAALSSNVDSDVAQGGRPDEALTVRMGMLTATLAPGAANATTQALTTSQPTGDPRKPHRP
jgi:hypothetical protein